MVQHQEDAFGAISELENVRGQNIQQHVDQGMAAASKALGNVKAVLKIEKLLVYIAFLWWTI